MKYTVEQFELDMENASSLSNKREVLEKALDSLNPAYIDKDFKEALLKHKDELKDLKESMDVEESERCLKDVEDGKVILYKCIKEGCENYKPGHNYYIKVDDYAKDLKANWSMDSVIPNPDIETSLKAISEIIGRMEPIIWIYSDNGIGSLMNKSSLVVPKDLFQSITKENYFNTYFEKI
jgi:hypothetical protein